MKQYCGRKLLTAVAKCRSQAISRYQDREMHAARFRLPVIVSATAIALLFLLFDVSIAPRWQLPGEVSLPDAGQEQRYSGCFDEADHRIHETAFGTIDNPDVQREFIATQRDKARAACRRQFPERFTTESLPFDFNLIDLDFRYD